MSNDIVLKKIINKLLLGYQSLGLDFDCYKVFVRLRIDFQANKYFSELKPIIKEQIDRLVDIGCLRVRQVNSFNKYTFRSMHKLRNTDGRLFLTKSMINNLMFKDVVYATNEKSYVSLTTKKVNDSSLEYCIDRYGNAKVTINKFPSFFNEHKSYFLYNSKIFSI